MRIFNKRVLISLVLGFSVFLGLVYYNYLLAQKAIRETKPAPLSIELLSFPEKVQASNSGTFTWQVNTSPDLYTSFTTVYWGYESSPSALTRSDSPQAASYPYSQTDYASGSFKLPDTFDVNIRFDKPARIFFRAYAKVKDDHLWSEEKYLDVIK